MWRGEGIQQWPERSGRDIVRRDDMVCCSNWEYMPPCMSRERTIEMITLWHHTLCNGMTRKGSNARNLLGRVLEQAWYLPLEVEDTLQHGLWSLLPAFNGDSFSHLRVIQLSARKPSCMHKSIQQAKLDHKLLEIYYMHQHSCEAWNSYSILFFLLFSSESCSRGLEGSVPDEKHKERMQSKVLKISAASHHSHIRTEHSILVLVWQSFCSWSQLGRTGVAKRQSIRDAGNYVSCAS